MMSKLFWLDYLKMLPLIIHLQTAVDGLDCILKIDPALAEVVEDCGGLTSLDDLQNHENETVFERVAKFMKKHFVTEDDELDVESNQASKM